MSDLDGLEICSTTTGTANLNSLFELSNTPYISLCQPSYLHKFYSCLFIGKKSHSIG
jgi:hypothetical protein